MKLDIFDNSLELFVSGSDLDEQRFEHHRADADFVERPILWAIEAVIHVCGPVRATRTSQEPPLLACQERQFREPPGSRPAIAARSIRIGPNCRKTRYSIINRRLPSRPNMINWDLGPDTLIHTFDSASTATT